MLRRIRCPRSRLHMQTPEGHTARLADSPVENLMENTKYAPAARDSCLVIEPLEFECFGLVTRWSLVRATLMSTQGGKRVLGSA